MSRTNWPFATLVVVVAATLTAALLGFVSPMSAAQFANSGHWGYNSVLETVFHIDGGTGNIDIEFPLDAERSTVVLQGDTSGFVVEQGRITEFNKAAPTEQQTSTPPAEDENPVSIEVVGGPYLVYRDAGQIVRLGDDPAVIQAGGAIGTPVVTDDGTMWLHRTGRGHICRLAKDAVTLSGCPVSAPRDHAGALAVVGERPVFVDLFTNTVHDLADDEFGSGTPLGVRLPPNARVAPRDGNGRLAILDPGQDHLVLVDVRSRPDDPVTKSLPPGDYDGPLTTGGVVVLVERQKGTVLTYGVDGTQRDDEPIEDKTGQPRLTQGEDERIYVEGEDGAQVVVVDEGGHVRDVDTTGDGTTSTSPAPEVVPGEPRDERSDEPRNDQRDNRPDGQPDNQSGEQPNGPGRTTGPPTDPLPAPVAPSRPGAPPSVAALAGDGTATVTWGAAADNRAPITSYVVSWQAGNGQTGSLSVAGDARRADPRDLVNGVRYVFTVAATNSVGTGPGASAAAVTPVAAISPAGAPGDLRAAFDPAARPNRDVTLTWTRPTLGGGALVHYEVTATGQASRLVTETQAVYPGLSAHQTVTFTVRAVTSTPGGQNMAGTPATTTVQGAPVPRLLLSKGPLTEEHCGEHDDCAWMHVELVGFPPKTRFHVDPHSSHADYHNGGHGTITDANGFADFDQFAYGGVGHTVWVTTTVDGTVIESNRITWTS